MHCKEEILKIAINLHCLIPPKWVIEWSPYIQNCIGVALVNSVSIVTSDWVPGIPISSND